MILIRLLVVYIIRACAHDILNDGIDSQSVNNVETIATLFNTSEPVVPDYTTGLKKRALRVGPYSEAAQASLVQAAPVVQAIKILFCIIVEVVYKSIMHLTPFCFTECLPH